MFFLDILDTCNTSSILSIILLTKEILQVIFIFIPIVLILMGAFDFAKNVFISKDDEYRKNISNFVRRVIVSVAIFFLPTLLSFFLNLLDDSGVLSSVEIMECYNNANNEKIAELKAEEETIKEEEEESIAEEKALSDAEREALEAQREEIRKAKAQDSEETITTDSSETVKVLLIGNSYTYVNGYGEMLAKMAKNTGKKLIVVRATKGGKGGVWLSSNKVNYKCWASYSTDCKNSSSTKYIKDILKIDFGDLDRANSWDYIIFQNNDVLSDIISGDKKIYNIVKGTISSSKHFIINATYYGKGYKSSRLTKHESAADDIDCSIINSGKIFTNYSNWYKLFTIRDDATHQSGQGAYLYALIAYARIYGTDDLYGDSNKTDKIKLYTTGSNTTKVLSSDNYRVQNATSSAMKVTESTSKELQAWVKNNYDLVFYR